MKHQELVNHVCKELDLKTDMSKEIIDIENSVSGYVCTRR